MKICVIISNDEWRQTAGVRIRYNRLQPVLEQAGHSLELVAIGNFTTPDSVNADAFVFSKTHDMRAVVLAHALRARGHHVGIDLFDDYYSQDHDSRFVHLRRWFRSILPALDFAMCSTIKMAQRLARLAPGLPCRIVNDPFDTLDADAIARSTAQAAARALREKRLCIGWFGIGDNPHFSLGLDDLFAFSGHLLAARRAGYSVELNLLTNLRSMTDARMEMLARLPVPYHLEEWTQEREAALIARSTLCFLPVNAQPFSVVKSLNRGVSTLTGGSQILSAGFPLYDLMEDFVYRDLASFIVDLEAGTLRLRAQTLPDLEALMTRYGSAHHEAQALVAFIADLPVRPHLPARCIAVVHGLNPVGDVHKALSRLGALSVAAPNTRRTLNFDIAPEPHAKSGPMALTLSEAGRAALRAPLRDKARQAGLINGKIPLYRLELDPNDYRDTRPVRPVKVPFHILNEASRYRRTMERTMALLTHVLEDPLILISENQSPYWGGPLAEPAPAHSYGKTTP
jgi:hypothetical protein